MSQPNFVIRRKTLKAVLAIAVYALTFSIVGQLQGQSINDMLVLPPSPEPDYAEYSSIKELAARFNITTNTASKLIDATIRTDYLGRGALAVDDVRLADFAKGSFLPSSIPATGQPFFGTDPRANVQGSGSAVRINGYLPRGSAISGSTHAEFVVDNATTNAEVGEGATLSIRQVFAQFNRVTVGATESAFADPSAVPEVVDLAGPNSRVTIYEAGIGSGQGRISYDFLSDEKDGLEITASLEQAIPEIKPLTGDRIVASHPDIVCATQYVEGYKESNTFVETWHLQFAAVFRDLGVESPGGADQHVFGWGNALSGAYRFRRNSQLETQDRVMFSLAYGEGISHYLVDLNAADDTADAVINGAGVLEALPVFAWYAAYTHNWTDYWRSTATYGSVNVEGTQPFGVTASPYESGDFVAVNLIYHSMFEITTPKETTKHNFFTGVEYLHGRKEALNGSAGDADRVMFVVAISK